MGVQIQKGGKILIALIGLMLILFVVYKLGMLDGLTGGKTDKKDGEVKDGKLPEKVLDKVRQTGVLRVGMEAEAPPMNYMEKGQRDGFDYQMAQEIAQRIGANRAEIVEADYDDLPNLLKQGKIDAMMGGYVPDPAIENVEWSDGYLDFGLCLIVKRSSAISDVKHLTGKKIGIYDDPAAETWVKENVTQPKEVKKYTGTGWFAKLDQGEVDAIIYDYPFAVAEIKSFPKLKIVKLNLNASRYAVGVAIKNDDLISAINRAIGDILNSERYSNLVQKYLSTSAVETGAIAKGSKTYTVKAGDTLSKIAQNQLGNKDDWEKIWALNKNRLANPHLITVGFQLLMP